MKVLVAAPSFGSMFHASLLGSLKKFFGPDGLVTQSVTDDPDAQARRLMRVLTEAPPDALIAISVRPNANTLAAYAAACVPIVLIDEEASGVSVVTTDNFQGGFIAGDYLLSTGKQKIGVVSGRTHVAGGYNAEQRLKGLRQALAARRLSMPQSCVIEVLHYSRADGIEVMPKLLDAGVDAVFCAAGDSCAVGLISVVKGRNLKIPEHIAIVGYDDLSIAQVAIPPLTTVRQPLEKIAEAVHTCVCSGSDLLKHPRRVVIAPELVVRASA